MQRIFKHRVRKAAVAGAVILILLGSLWLCGWWMSRLGRSVSVGMAFTPPPDKENPSPLVLWMFRSPGSITALVVGSPAYRAGLRMGDRILSVDGVSVSDRSRLLALAEHGRVDRAISYGVVSEGVRRTVVLRPESPLHSILIFVLVLLASVAMTTLILHFCLVFPKPLALVRKWPWRSASYSVSLPRCGRITCPWASGYCSGRCGCLA